MRMLLILLFGCSVALGTKPPNHPCTAHPFYWLADAGGAIAATGAAVYGGIWVKDDQINKVIPGVGAMAAIIYLASAGNGYRWTNQCRALVPPATAER